MGFGQIFSKVLGSIGKQAEKSATNNITKKMTNAGLSQAEQTAILDQLGKLPARQRTDALKALVKQEVQGGELPRGPAVNLVTHADKKGRVLKNKISRLNPDQTQLLYKQLNPRIDPKKWALVGIPTLALGGATMWATDVGMAQVPLLQETTNTYTNQKNIELQQQIAELQAQLNAGQPAAPVNVDQAIQAAGITDENAVKEVKKLLEEALSGQLDDKGVKTKASKLVERGVIKPEQWDAVIAALSQPQGAPTLTAEQLRAAVLQAGLTGEAADQLTQVLEKAFNGQMTPQQAKAQLEAMTTANKLTPDQWVAVQQAIANQLKQQVAQQPATTSSGGATSPDPNAAAATPASAPAATAPAKTAPTATTSPAKPATQPAAPAGNGANTTGADKLAQIIEQSNADQITPEQTIQQLNDLVASGDMTEAEFNQHMKEDGFTYTDIKAAAEAAKQPTAQQQPIKPMADIRTAPPETASAESSATESTPIELAQTPTQRTKPAGRSTTTAVEPTDDGSKPITSLVTPNASSTNQADVEQAFALYGQDPRQLQTTLNKAGRVFQSAQQAGQLELLASDGSKMLSFASMGTTPDGQEAGILATEYKVNAANIPLSTVSMASAVRDKNGRFQVGRIVSYATAGGQVQALDKGFQNASTNSVEGLLQHNAQVLQSRFGGAMLAAKQLQAMPGNAVASSNMQGIPAQPTTM